MGDEWSDSESLQQALEEFLFPYIDSSKVVGEIGSGGGRVAAQTVGKVQLLHCFGMTHIVISSHLNLYPDIAENMLKKAKAALSSHNNAKFHLVQSNKFPEQFSSEYFDLIYSFDVFPHLDLHSVSQKLFSPRFSNSNYELFAISRFEK